MLKRDIFLNVTKNNKLMLVATIIFVLIALPSLYLFDQKVRSDVYKRQILIRAFAKAKLLKPLPKIHTFIIFLILTIKIR